MKLYGIPSGVVGLMREVLRHVLRRPVVGIVVAGHTDDGRWLLVQRGDTGTWALPGGTVEWGETLRSTFDRELEEEAHVRCPAARACWRWPRGSRVRPRGGPPAAAGRP